MSDRFYMQRDHTSCGSLPKVVNRSSAKTKAEMATELGHSFLSKLSVKDLQTLCLSRKTVNVEAPTGRLKAPFIEACKGINSTVDWSKLTIADMKQLL